MKIQWSRQTELDGNEENQMNQVVRSVDIRVFPQLWASGQVSWLSDLQNWVVKSFEFGEAGEGELLSEYREEWGRPSSCAVPIEGVR